MSARGFLLVRACPRGVAALRGRFFGSWVRFAWALWVPALGYVDVQVLGGGGCNVPPWCMPSFSLAVVGWARSVSISGRGPRGDVNLGFRSGFGSGARGSSLACLYHIILCFFVNSFLNFFCIFCKFFLYVFRCVEWACIPNRGGRYAFFRCSMWNI